MFLPKITFFFLITLLLFSGSGWAQTLPKKVVFIRYRIPVTYFSTVVNGFKDNMTRRGYIEGVDIEYIDVVTRSADLQSVPDVLTALEKWKGQADMIITCGWVSMYARKELINSTTPQLFVPVLESVAHKMLSSVKEEPGTNLSGLYLMYPPEKVLRLTRLLLPSIKNYAYVYNSNVPADMPFKGVYENLPPEDRYDLTIHFIDLADGVEAALTKLDQLQIEAFGGAVGLSPKMRELAVSNIPVVTSYLFDIEQDELAEQVREGNILAGLFNPFRYCGEQAADMTADIFAGKNTIEKTIPRPAKQLAFINMETAARFGIPIPFAALEAVDLVTK